MSEMIQMIFQGYFPLIRIQLADLLDIAIMTGVIYKLLWMLRKTSSGRVLRGILILLLAMVVSSAISLTATSFLLCLLYTSGEEHQPHCRLVRPH